MRYFSLLLMGLICVPCFVRSGFVRAADPVITTDQSAAPEETSQTETLPKEQIQFDGQKLNLAWQADNSGDSVKEFIPEGQTLEKWTKLASIREYPKLNDAQELAAAIVHDVNEKDPRAAAQLSYDAKTGEAVIDFLMWSEDKSFVEFNVWKFYKQEDGGVVGEQYALRDYKDPEAFVKNLKPARERLVKQMTKDGLQTDE